jgi:hypothetical protein
MAEMVSLLPIWEIDADQVHHRLQTKPSVVDVEEEEK